MSAPKRLGLVSLHQLCQKAIRIITKFQSKMQEWLTSEEYAKVIALLACLQDVFNDVPQYPTDPPS